MRIEEGKYYITASGKVIGPAKYNKRRPLYPWRLDGQDYTNDGKFNRFLPHEDDILNELSPLEKTKEDV